MNKMRVGYYIASDAWERDYENYVAGVLALFDAMARGPVAVCILPRGRILP